MNLKSFDKSEMKDSIVLTATFEMPEVKAELILRYCINAEGEVSVTEKMTTDKAAKVADLFRYGMVLDLPASFSKLEYYGRGPEENYIDRHSSTFIGKYESDVKDEYYPYVRPQESGNHTDIRYFSISILHQVRVLLSRVMLRWSAVPFLILLRIWILVMKGACLGTA